MPGTAAETLHSRLDALRAVRTEANRDFFAAEAERLARCCHSMAERFARGDSSRSGARRWRARMRVTSRSSSSIR